MKKILLCLCVLLFVNASKAQDMIPLFDDVPSFQEKKTPSDAATTKTDPVADESVEKNEVAKQDISLNNSKPAAHKRPRLGREAAPLKSLVLAPFPNVTVELEAQPEGKPLKKKFDEEPTVNEDILTRSNPLNVTEQADSYDDYLQRLIDNRVAVRQEEKEGEATNPFGQRHDVRGFLLADVSLGMTPEEAESVLLDRGYKLTKIEKSISLFKTTQYANICRTEKKLAVLKDVRECVLSYAEDEEQQYIKTLVFERASTRETITIDFTSPVTDNVAFRVFYVGRGDNSLHTSRKNMAKKIARKNDFWNLIFDTYGLPDDSEKILWGNPDTAYMMAAMFGSSYDAYIKMESLVLQDQDYLAAQEELKEIPQSASFTFADKE